MLSKQLRQFVEVTCAAFQTKELPSEASARQRQQQTQAKNHASQSGPRPKSFNMLTYKYHALGDYAQTIELFGTTDSYTTQIVSGIRNTTSHWWLSDIGVQGELSHRLIKKFYGFTSKRNVSKQLAKQERRFTHIQRQEGLDDPPTMFEVSDMDTIPELHHVLSSSPNHIVNLKKLLCDLRARGDPAIKVKNPVSMPTTTRQFHWYHLCRMTSFPG